jgi:hypothetical protein
MLSLSSQIPAHHSHSPTTHQSHTTLSHMWPVLHLQSTDSHLFPLPTITSIHISSTHLASYKKYFC